MIKNIYAYPKTNRKLNLFFLVLFFLIFTIPLIAQKKITIKNIQEDIVYVYDGFEKASLKKKSGFGWSGKWDRDRAGDVSLLSNGLHFNYRDYTPKGGCIEFSNGKRNSLERFLEHSYGLKQSNFYTSFLIKKSKASFVLEGYGGGNLRYGMKIGANGSVSIRNSAKWGESFQPGLLKDNATYLVVLSKENTLFKIAIFETGQEIPEKSSSVVWSYELNCSPTGVYLDRFAFAFYGGKVWFDEFRMSSTFKSATSALKN